MYKYYKRYFLALLFTMCSICGFSQDENYTTLSTSIEFIVNTDEIIKNDNYYYYINTIVPEITRNKDNMSYVLLVGSASPEGNADNNVVLSKRRADKIYSYISSTVPESKVEINNCYDLFLSKTKVSEDDYPKLRATYVEVSYLNGNKSTATPFNNVITDTVFIEKEVFVKKEKTEKELALSLYNDIVGDLVIRKNIGFELYFKQMSYFVEGSFSQGKLYDKVYDIQLWHTGFRKYFNDDFNKYFIEIYGRTGFFDTTVLNDNGNFGTFYGTGIGLGYKFDIGKHWKIYPLLRIGLDYYANENYYYLIQNGNINALFNSYTNGKSTKSNENSVSTVSNGTQTTYTIDKNLNDEFYRNSSKRIWFGPTYLGLIIQRDFFIKRK